MDTNSETPCKNCICVPICREKLLGDLRKDCSILGEGILPFKYLEKVEKVLKPTRWKTDTGHYGVKLLRQDLI